MFSLTLHANGLLNLDRLLFKQLCEMSGKSFKFGFSVKGLLEDEEVIISKLLPKLIPETNCFILREHVFEGLARKEGEFLPGQKEWAEIDMPFKTCSFEMYHKTAMFGFEVRSPEGEIQEARVFCFWAHELSPEEYYIILGYTLPKNVGFFVRKVSKKDPTPEGSMAVLRAICIGLKKSALGLDKKTFYIKRGSGSSKGNTSPNQVVHVVPRKEKEIAKGLGGAPIDWSHRWEVRGHWRKQDGIGKDRAGEYQVRGWTWVVPHIKGPEDKLLVKKIRIVEGIDHSPTAELQ